MDNIIYLDNASTTHVSSEVLQEMLPVFTSSYGNAGSLHQMGREALALVERARVRVAKAIGADASEIYFTSGATEANNLAIIGIALANKEKGNHIITSQIEHPSVLNACKKLEEMGFKVTYLPVDEYGMVSIAKLLDAISKETILVSIMAANNEVGTIQNIRTIAKIAHDKDVYFHTDATQAIGSVSINVKNMGIDSLSLSAHKIYGPKGVGALYIKNGIECQNLTFGGEQEKHLRAGTVNVAGVVGLGKAIEIASRDMFDNVQKVKFLREYLIRGIKANIEGIKLNGHPLQRLCGNVNISFECIEGESILLLLDEAGICVSTGSACTSTSLDPSHVLTAMNVPAELAQGSIRFSIGKNNTKMEMDYVIEQLKKVAQRLREISPIRRKRS